MTAVYKENFTDGIKRMEKIQKHLLSSSSLSIRGAALGINISPTTALVKTNVLK